MTPQDELAAALRTEIAAMWSDAPEFGPDEFWVDAEPYVRVGAVNDAIDRLTAVHAQEPQAFDAALARNIADSLCFVQSHPHLANDRRCADSMTVARSALMALAALPAQVAAEPAKPCQHLQCDEPGAPAGEPGPHQAIVALAWALAELSEDGPHGSNERRRFRPLARTFLRHLKRDPQRAEAVAAALRLSSEAVPAGVELRRAAENVSDRRTLLDDGFWVSRKEMRALDAALGRKDMGTVATPEPETDGGGGVTAG